MWCGRETQNVGRGTPSAKRPLGAHMWATGGVHLAVERGAEIGCDVVQVFTRNPNQWSPKALTRQAVEACRLAQEGTGVRLVASHDSYLINLATSDRTILRRSLTAMHDELRRADLLGIEWVVAHLGAHLGDGIEVGLRRLVNSLNRVIDQATGLAPKIALEATAGQGSTLGFRFEHLAFVLDEVECPERFGVCLDTCHVHAAGYRWRGPKGYDGLWQEFDAVIGLDRLKLIHANDAKRERGSRVDRHEHLGNGTIGLATFRRLVQDPRLAGVPIILETPKVGTMDEVNLGILKSFRRQTASRSVRPRPE